VRASILKVFDSFVQQRPFVGVRLVIDICTISQQQSHHCRFIEPEGVFQRCPVKLLSKTRVPCSVDFGAFLDQDMSYSQLSVTSSDVKESAFVLVDCINRCTILKKKLNDCFEVGDRGNFVHRPDHGLGRISPVGILAFESSFRKNLDRVARLSSLESRGPFPIVARSINRSKNSLPRYGGRSLSKLLPGGAVFSEFMEDE
jgi:hypothetical protein